MDLETVLDTIAQYYAQNISPYLVADYQGEPFQRFGLSHLIVLGITLLLILLILLTRQKLDAEDKASLREVMAQILIINEIISYLWLYFYQGIDTVKMIYGIPITIIPVSLLSIFAWISAFMLLKKSQKLYELTYLIGILVALYALIFPDLALYGFPHYRFFYTFISPAIILLSAIYMSVAEEEIELGWKSLLRVFLTANIFMAIVFGLNTYFGGNYLYLNAKPAGNLLLDLLPDYPIYLLYLEGIGIVGGVLLYLPFIVRDGFRKRNLRADTTRIDKYIQ